MKRKRRKQARRALAHYYGDGPLRLPRFQHTIISTLGMLVRPSKTESTGEVDYRYPVLIAYTPTREAA